VPVSPSGTGNTLRRLISSWCALSQLRLPSSACFRSWPSTFWGPLPLAWMWVGSQVDYQSGSTFLGIITAFLGLLFTLMLGLVVVRRIDVTWILVRRAGGIDQRQGTIGRVFAVASVIGAIAFGTWLLLFSGAEFAPIGINI